jgi:hypothetical protein
MNMAHTRSPGVQQIVGIKTPTNDTIGLDNVKIVASASGVQGRTDQKYPSASSTPPGVLPPSSFPTLPPHKSTPTKSLMEKHVRFDVLRRKDRADRKSSKNKKKSKKKKLDRGHRSGSGEREHANMTDDEMDIFADPSKHKIYTKGQESSYSGSSGDSACDLMDFSSASSSDSGSASSDSDSDSGSSSGVSDSLPNSDFQLPGAGTPFMSGPANPMRMSGGGFGEMNREEKIKKKARILAKLERKIKSSGKKIIIPENAELEVYETLYEKVCYETDSDSSVKLYRRLLMWLVTVEETLSKKFPMLGMDLDKWSESVFLTLDSYDDMLYDVYDEYGDTVKMNSIARLVMAVQSNAIMYSTTRKLMAQGAEQNKAMNMGTRAGGSVGHPQLSKIISESRGRQPNPASVPMGAQVPGGTRASSIFGSGAARAPPRDPPSRFIPLPLADSDSESDSGFGLMTGVSIGASGNGLMQTLRKEEDDMRAGNQAIQAIASGPAPVAQAVQANKLVSPRRPPMSSSVDIDGTILPRPDQDSVTITRDARSVDMSGPASKRKGMDHSKQVTAVRKVPGTVPRKRVSLG